MTEGDADLASPVDPAATARLARLQARSSSDRTQPPAAASKVVAAGASAMAVLGLMAVYGQRANGSIDSTGTSPVAVVSATIPATSAPSADAPVIVVLVDDAGSAVPGVVDGADDVTVVTLAPPEAPTRVDLAVPAPEVVAVPNQQPAPAQATSSGS